MDSYRESTLVFRLVSEGLRSNGAATPALHSNKGPGAANGAHSGEVPAKAREEKPLHGGGMGNSGKGRGRNPAKFTGRNVNNSTGEGDFGEPFHMFVDDTMAKAMSRGAWRVVRTVPRLMILVNE